MITILLHDNIATFKYDHWTSENEDEVQEQMLNDTFDINTISPGDVYRISKYDPTVTGIDAIALDAIANWKPKVINHSDEAFPEEQEGILI